MSGGIIFVFFYAINYARQHEGREPLALFGDHADVRIDKFSFVQSRNGGRDWELIAREATVYNEDSTALLDGVHVTLYGKKRLNFNVDADKGILNMSTKDIYLKRLDEPIAIVLANGYTIYAPSIQWVNTRREIVSEGPVKIVGPQIEIHGEHFSVAADTGDLKVSGNVLAEIH